MSVFSAVKNGIARDLKFLTTRAPRRRGSNPVIDNNNYGQTDWFYMRPSLAGIRVDEELALTLTAVYRSVSIIASTIASLPLHIYKSNQFAEAEIEEVDDTAYLWNRPNPEMTRMTFWETVIAHEVLNGNAYIFVVKNQDGRPLQLWPLAPWRVAVGRYEGQKIYQVDGAVPMKDFSDGGEIVHILNMSRDGMIGKSPIRLAAEAIELTKAGEEYSARFYGQNSTPTGTLTTDQPLTQVQTQELARLWTEQHAGLNNRNIAVLSSGAKFQAISINPEDAQLLEGRRFQVAEIARLFGIPPHLLADMERTTSWGSGLEEQGINFLRFTLMRHIEAFEQAIDDALLRRVETRRKAKFVVDGLLRASYAVRMQGHATAFGRFMTANEIRKQEGLPPIEGGDTLLAMTNLAPATAIEDVTMNQPAPAPAIGAA